MFTRKAACLAVVCAVLTVGSAAYGAFSADLYWGDEAAAQVANTLEIPEAQATIELVLWDNQVFGSAGTGSDYIQWVHLNFQNSSAALNAIASWTWDPTLFTQLGSEASLDPVAAVGRSKVGAWVPAASLFRVGKLTINKPAYIDGGVNDYLLSLAGGNPDLANPTVTFVAADIDQGGFAAASQGNLQTQDVAIHILPEPATIALLGVGAAMTFIRRRKRA